MTEYRALALKNKTVNVGIASTKIKVGSMARTDIGEVNVRLVPLKDSKGKSFLVTVEFEGKWVTAGRIYNQGIGRYAIASNNPVYVDGALRSQRSKHQPMGYLEADRTIAWSAERVVNEFLGSIDYARRQAAGQEA